MGRPTETHRCRYTTNDNATREELDVSARFTLCPRSTQRAPITPERQYEPHEDRRRHQDRRPESIIRPHELQLPCAPAQPADDVHAHVMSAALVSCVQLQAQNHLTLAETEKGKILPWATFRPHRFTCLHAFTLVPLFASGRPLRAFL